MVFFQTGCPYGCPASGGSTLSGGVGSSVRDPVAPVFADFSGKVWEGEYPRLLAAYYDAVQSSRVGRSGGVSEDRNDKVFTSYDELPGRVSAFTGDSIAMAGNRTDLQGGRRIVELCDSEEDERRASELSSIVKNNDSGEGHAVHSIGLNLNDVSREFPGEQLSDEKSGVASVGDGIVTVRGKNWARNQEWKREKKNRKNKRQAMSKDWRKNGANTIVADNIGATSAANNSSSAVVVDKKQGFFSDCSEDIKRQLRDTRAAALIEKNKVEAAKAKQQYDRFSAVTDEMRLAQSMLHVVKIANQLKKTTTDNKIGGWAQTVADSLTRSVAESAPSSLPSLEEVGYGKSALKSSDGSFVSSERVQEYQAKVKILESEFEDHGVYQTYEEDLFMLKQEYGDVALPPEERYKDKYNKELTDKLMSAGVSPMIIDEALGTGIFFSKNY